MSITEKLWNLFNPELQTQARLQRAEAERIEHFVHRVNESQMPEQMKAALRTRGHLMQPAGDAIAYANAMRDIHSAAHGGAATYLTPACMAVVENVPIEDARRTLIAQRAAADTAVTINTTIAEPTNGSVWRRSR